jgi:hypothetical protein
MWKQKARYNRPPRGVNGKVIEHSPKQLVADIGREEQDLHLLPTIRSDCPKCGNNTANVWQFKTRQRRIVHTVHTLRKNAATPSENTHNQVPSNSGSVQVLMAFLRLQQRLQAVTVLM